MYNISMTNMDEAIREEFDSYSNTFYEVNRQAEASSLKTQLWIPACFGEGKMNLRKLSDLTFSMEDSRFARDISIDNTLMDATFDISINFGSDASYLVGNQAFDIASQTLTLSYFQAQDNYTKFYSANKAMGHLSFTFSKQQILQYLSHFENTDLMHAVTRADRSQVFSHTKLDAKQRYLIQKLRENPYSGTLEKLYFESVAGELLIAMLESLSGTQHSAAQLTTQDRDRLYHARVLLLKDPRNPPTIPALATAVGLNEEKLKRGFKTLFANTIFKTLTDYRMQQAAELVRKGDMSIAEIAHESGYENVSKFIATFKRTFGVTPGKMRKEIRYFLPSV